MANGGEALLTSEEVNQIILEIVIGEKIVHFNSSIPTSELNYPDTFLFRQPTGFERLWANNIEKVSLLNALDMGLLRDDDLPQELIEKFFTEEDQNQLDTINNKIKAYDTMVKKGIRGSVIHEQNVQKLSDLKAEAKTLQNKRGLAKQLSADFKAAEDKYYALMVKCVLNINREPIWASLEELESETDIDYLERLLYEQFLPFLTGYGTSILRFIARSGEWGNRFYSSIHTGQPLFSKEAGDLSIDQQALLSWSIFYYDISQMAEEYKPDDDVLNNDVKLDEYIEQLSRHLKAERLNKKKLFDRGLSQQSNNHQNVIVTADSNEYVPLHKNKVYSDPREITGRVEDSSRTAYNEASAAREAKRKLKKLKHKK